MAVSRLSFIEDSILVLDYTRTESVIRGGSSTRNCWIIAWTSSSYCSGRHVGQQSSNS